MPTCQTCGDTFEVSAQQQAKFPGWTPKQCPACFRNSSRGGGGRRGRRKPVEQNLTLAEVLQTYTDGPDTGVFTDGSATPNPGPGGWGAVYVVDGEVIDQAHGHVPDTTNNRMELTALHCGIGLVPPSTAATVYSDSRLVVDTVTKWAAGWAARGWRRKSGPIANLDLVRPLYEDLQQRPELQVEWIAAHSGNRWNEYADSLSTAWSREDL